jgi:hypothetical protein
MCVLFQQHRMVQQWSRPLLITPMRLCTKTCILVVRVEENLALIKKITNTRRSFTDKSADCVYIYSINVMYICLLISKDSLFLSLLLNLVLQMYPRHKDCGLFPKILLVCL